MNGLGQELLNMVRTGACRVVVVSLCRVGESSCLRRIETKLAGNMCTALWRFALRLSISDEREAQNSSSITTDSRISTLARAAPILLWSLNCFLYVVASCLKSVTIRGQILQARTPHCICHRHSVRKLQVGGSSEFLYSGLVAKTRLITPHRPFSHCEQPLFTHLSASL
jgi:hypothetical protein